MGKEYIVAWHVSVRAKNPRDAARKAHTLMMLVEPRRDSSNTTFEVQDRVGGSTMVDLHDDFRTD